MDRIFSLKFVGVKTGNAKIDAVMEYDNTKRAVLELTATSKDFDRAVELANLFLQKFKPNNPDVYIWGVCEVDPDDKEDAHGGEDEAY